jgi:hypothetical protein
VWKQVVAVVPVSARLMRRAGMPGALWPEVSHVRPSGDHSGTAVMPRRERDEREVLRQLTQRHQRRRQALESHTRAAKKRKPDL